MLTDEQLDRYFKEHEISKDACDYIREVRASDPYRPVGDQASANVVVKFYSEKMGCQIAAESHTAELSFVKWAEYSPDVLEYYDQPRPVEIYKVAKTGNKRRDAYTPDYLVLTTNGPEIVEVKHWKEIEKLLARDPKNWKEADAGIEYVPAAQAFTEIGIPHTVHVYQQTDNILLANLSLILAAPASLDLKEIRQAQCIQSYLADNAWATLKEIKEALELASLSLIFSLLRQHKLVAALDRQLLADPEVAIVSTSDRLLDEGVQAAANSDPIAPDSADGVPITKAPSKLAADKAIENLSHLDSGKKDRKWRRLKVKETEGLKRGLSRFQSMIPDFHKRGNRKSRLVPVISEFLIQFIQEKYSDNRAISLKKGFQEYKLEAKKEHPTHSPVSVKTFQTYYEQCDRREMQRNRGGRRLANQSADPSCVFDRAIRQEIPFLAASIDHCNVSLHTVVAIIGDKIFTAKCWLTGIVDVGTGCLLGRYFSLHPPSRVSCAMAIRDCIRRHGKLPLVIMSDRGKEFESVYYDSVIAHFGSCSALRPAEFSRYGAEIERLFETFEQTSLNLLPGYFKSIESARSRSRSHSAQANASLWPKHLIEQFDTFIQHEQERLVGASIESASQKLSNHELDFSFVGKDIEMSDEIMVITAVDSKSYKLDRSRGLHNEYDLHFWSPELSKLRHGQKVEVRTEPEDPYRIYARVGDRWVTCFASREPVFVRRSKSSREEIALLVQKPHELRQRIRDFSSEALMNAQGSLLEGQLLEVEQGTPIFSTTRHHEGEDVWSRLDEFSAKIIPIEIEVAA